MSIEDKYQSLISYFKEPARRKTFQAWPFKNNEKCNANKMAEAGFIFSGSSRDPDSAQCFFCHKHLDGWESTDDPWDEHLNHSKECSFAKMKNAQSHWTAAEWFELYSQYRRNLIERKYDEQRKKVKELFDKIRSE
ncbi:unnamed protein product [Ceutorhynchus assimilis]|uniref:Uncharacterized protein n=1 Tax=Ceutorhynchus assimilis TaxID=467358 RepID=A0A9N9QJR5_9CUCU|nr:unnamed protein product [Ceutorhynchus assimilis]